jgi:hypothetical protein
MAGLSLDFNYGLKGLSSNCFRENGSIKIGLSNR